MTHVTTFTGALKDYNKTARDYAELQQRGGPQRAAFDDHIREAVKGFRDAVYAAVPSDVR